MSLNLFMFFVFIFGCVSVISSIVDGHTGLETTSLTVAVTETDTTINVFFSTDIAGGLVIDSPSHQNPTYDCLNNLDTRQNQPAPTPLKQRRLSCAYVRICG